jgi:hypothetical protein
LATIASMRACPFIGVVRFGGQRPKTNAPFLYP